MILRLPGREVSFPRRPLVMGIVNINDDSFSGDGDLDPERVLAQVCAQSESGADMIDLGAESARTNRAAIPSEEEVRRLRPVLDAWPEALERLQPRDDVQMWPPVLSVNTWRPEVIEAVLPYGVEFINDMSALPDDRNARLCAEAGAALLIMHSKGAPKEAHRGEHWEDIMATLERFFREKSDLAMAAGMSAEHLVLDPGIDFAKEKEDNLAIYRELGKLAALGRPILLPVSRKGVIGDVLGIEDPKERDAGTMASVALGIEQGAQIFRVHNVDAAWSCVKVVWEVVSVD